MEQPWGTGVFLLLCSLWDIRSGRLPVWLLALGLFGGVLSGIIRTGSAEAVLTGMLPGLLLRLLALFCPGRIGEGDGWVLTAAGAAGGPADAVFILEAGLLFTLPPAFYYGIIRKERHKELPLCPFLFGGFLLKIFL